MDVNSYLEHCDEQNRQVNEKEKQSPRKKDDDTSDETVRLQERVQALKETMSTLRMELLEEKELWRKEMEEMSNLLATSERISESDPNLSPEHENEYKPIANVTNIESDPLMTSPLIREYEEKLSRYQGALAQAQAEKRYNIRRQIAANTYRKRLNEVEKLCQEELAKVRETATYLEPLKQMASEWNKDLSPREKTKRQSTQCGDFLNVKGKEMQVQDKFESFEVPVKQIDASLVMDEDATNEIKGKIVLQIGSLPSEVPTICYSAKFE